MDTKLECGLTGTLESFKLVSIYSNINPFTPEPPVTACADPRPF